MRLIAGFLFVFWSSAVAHAVDAQVAVAANFTAAARALGAAYQEKTGHAVGFSFGSTGQLYAQISQGAPFDAFLAADQDSPVRAEAAGFAIAGSRFTYATGRLALYCAQPDCRVDAGTLPTGLSGRLAIANPATAPYGAAAVHVMKALGIYEALVPQLVLGANVAQAYQFVVTGNAEYGFVALSQVVGQEGYWLVPRTYHEAIKQDAVLLQHGAGNAAAEGFLAFLKSPEALAIIARHGYDPAEGGT